MTRAAPTCRYLRCGERRLFAGLPSVRPACPVRRLGLSARDASDGSAVFVIFFLGLIVVGLAAWVALKFAPPIWVPMALWTPLILGGAIAMPRPIEAAMIALRYRHRIIHEPPPA